MMTDYDIRFALKCAKYQPEQLTDSLIAAIVDETLRECSMTTRSYQDARVKILVKEGR